MDFHTIALVQALILVALANTAPVVAKKALGGFAAWPLDFGAVFIDGRPLFGKSKTFRGVALAAAAAALAAALMGLSWRIGALVGVASMAGDLCSSFIKRRLGVPSSGRAPLLDQGPEALFGLIAAAGALSLNVVDIVVGTIAFFVGQVLGSRLFFALKLRDEPY